MSVFMLACAGFAHSRWLRVQNHTEEEQHSTFMSNNNNIHSLLLAAQPKLPRLSLKAWG